AIVNLESDLELVRRPFRQIDHLAKLVTLLSVGDAVVHKRAERPAPRGDGGEPVTPPGRKHRPIVQHDWLADRPPLHARRWNAALRRADASRDRVVEIVPAQRERALLVPDLGI